MNLRLSYRIYRLRARILRNMLAMISLSAMLTACGSATQKEDKKLEDSLQIVREKQKLDSMARVDSLAKAATDSLADIKRRDSLAAAQTNVPVIYVVPVVTDPYPAICEYGVIPDFNELPQHDDNSTINPGNVYPVTKYGVPVD